MISGKRFLAVIPARGGSKSVPRKNLVNVAGAPLLVHTLEQAAAVPEIDLTVVSTEDAEIAEVARVRGCRVIDRPRRLANDEASTESALLHALSWLEDNEGQSFDFVVTLEPTSPLRTPETIHRCMCTIVEKGGRSLMTVVASRSNYGNLIDGVFRPLVSAAPRRRQMRQPLYKESSTVYVATVELLRATSSLVVDDWLAVEIAEEEAVDINSRVDVLVAESIMRDRQSASR